MKNHDKILISACLVGDKCRYNGASSPSCYAIKLFKQGNAVKFCPELLAGLPTPRNPIEIIGGHGYDVLNGSASVVDKKGNDYTVQFITGAQKALELVKKHSATKVILKANSPSCGCGRIYDGSFSGKLIDGVGVTAALLIKNGIEVEVMD